MKILGVLACLFQLAQANQKENLDYEIALVSLLATCREKGVDIPQEHQLFLRDSHNHGIESQRDLSNNFRQLTCVRVDKAL